jgi:GntP family gluconate:H+ symporter
MAEENERQFPELTAMFVYVAPFRASLTPYLLALPVACSITAFIILEPVIKSLGKADNSYKALLYVAAIGSLISFTLIFPTPVTISAY